MQTSINPATGKKIRDYAEHSAKETADIVDAAHACFTGWRKTSFAERAAHLRSVSDVILKHKDSCATLMAEEMGKPLKEAIAEMEK